MRRTTVYIDDDQDQWIKRLGLSHTEIYRQGYILEAIMQGDEHFLNQYNLTKVTKLLSFHAKAIEDLQEQINYHKEMINKLKGGLNKNAISNKKDENNRLSKESH
jgi:hypothetical protein